uniref:Ubiquitin-like domain-containing protein n=1 Tax=Gopherus agassizii TaxID=38772 RepID=A0A452ILT5_9SAUR
IELPGRVSVLDVCWEDTGVDLKRRVIQKIGRDSDVDGLRLVFAGKQLEDARSLRHQGLTNHCTVHLVKRCKCWAMMGGECRRRGWMGWPGEWVIRGRRGELGDVLTRGWKGEEPGPCLIGMEGRERKESPTPAVGEGAGMQGAASWPGVGMRRWWCPLLAAGRKVQW